MEVADQQHANVPDGWEVVSAPSHANVPDGWQVVSDNKSETKQPSTNTALTGAALGASVRPLATAAAELATNPNVAKGVASLGRVIGGAAPVVGGAAELGPAGALLGMGQVAKGAWAGGRAGYFSGKLIQNMAAPVARALDTLAPYAQAISTVSGAQGVLDLAQMADKTRKDIGFLGISLDKDDRSDAEKAAHPDLVTAVAGKIKDLSNALARANVTAPDANAVKLLSDGNPSLFGRLMTIYLRGKAFGG